MTNALAYLGLDQSKRKRKRMIMYITNEKRLSRPRDLRSPITVTLLAIQLMAKKAEARNLVSIS
jgi:hypothetical protein